MNYDTNLIWNDVAAASGFLASLVSLRSRGRLLCWRLTIVIRRRDAAGDAHHGRPRRLLVAFEAAGSVDRAAEILADWGDGGKRAIWWQLALDLPFLLGYGLFAARACAAVAAPGGEIGKPRLQRAADASLGSGRWLLPATSLRISPLH